MLSNNFIDKGAQYLAFSNLGGHCGHQITQPEFTSVVNSYLAELTSEVGSENVNCEIDYWKHKLQMADKFAVDMVQKALPWLK